MIEDTQWKIANYLTTNYKLVIVGNFSTKKMGEQKKISKMLKRIASIYSLYQLKCKIKYKCSITNTKYKESDEMYTTQCCSRCGNRKKDVGLNRTYECDKCGHKSGRYINSSVDILITSINQ